MSRRICKPLSYNSPVNFHSLFDACEKHIRAALLKPLRHRVHLGNSQGLGYDVLAVYHLSELPQFRSDGRGTEIVAVPFQRIIRTYGFLRRARAYCVALYVQHILHQRAAGGVFPCPLAHKAQPAYVFAHEHSHVKIHGHAAFGSRERQQRRLHVCAYAVFMLLRLYH